MRRALLAKGGSTPALFSIPGRWLREAGDALLSVALPSGCRICASLLNKATRIPVCDECIASFKRIDGLVCDKCGSPIEAAAGISGAGAGAYGASAWMRKLLFARFA